MQQPAAHEDLFQLLPPKKNLSGLAISFALQPQALRSRLGGLNLTPGALALVDGWSFLLDCSVDSLSFSCCFLFRQGLGLR